MTELAAVLFDMDGTLVETESMWHEAEIRTMAHFGAGWSTADRDISVGGPFDRVIEYMAEKVDADPGDVARAMVTEIETMMGTRMLVAQPGVADLHSAIVAAGIPTALVSNSWRVLMDLVLVAVGLDFDVTIAGDEVSANKPDPLPYLKACELLNVSPADVVVIEDSNVGVASATAAGCSVVAIRSINAIGPAPRRLIVASLTEVNLATLREVAAS